jgi:hypothetical protein
MNLTPEIYAEICKQSAFISALVAGFSFAFLGTLLVSQIKNRIIDLIMSFSIVSIAGLLVCALAWTLSASRMAIYTGSIQTQVPEVFINIHRILSFVFILCFLSFLITLGLSGWIRSKTLGIVSSFVSLLSLIFFFVVMRNFIS